MILLKEIVMRGYGSTQASPLASVSCSFMEGNSCTPPVLAEGMTCLIACVTPNNVVAHGRVVNPVAHIVHTLSMGNGTCTVIVDHVIDGSTSLIFSIDDKIIIGEVLRYVIPWPTWLISHDNQV
ncbi:hypothetical protein AXF42_Ash005367 [Apostasia shenzhenica]|uniref:DUF8039 domain-containing protein n=1 Tax=Apostasia shenzhenica TaxID=1088818 RepID=A0A2I0B6R2_9ASPA|nr:hypothetical protein AXF42_Ash005367 [Apostasia shenzhenica]